MGKFGAPERPGLQLQVPAKKYKVNFRILIKDKTTHRSKTEKILEVY